MPCRAPKAGALGNALLAGDGTRARLVAARLAAQFPGRFYLELQCAALPGQEALVRASVALAAELRLPVVSTHPVQSLGPDDFEAHEARVCIAEGYVLNDKRRVKQFTAQQYFKTQAEMSGRASRPPRKLGVAVHQNVCGGADASIPTQNRQEGTTQDRR